MSGKNAETLGWTIVLDQDLAEINQTVIQVLINNGIVALILILLLGSVGLWFANSISKPINIMARGMDKLRNGEISRETDINVLRKILNRKDELGLLGNSITDTEEYFTDMAEIASQIAEGNLTVNRYSQIRK